jgi:hypothetical protein
LSKKLGKQLSEGYDLADAEADGLTAEDMRQAIEEWQRAHEAYHSPPEAKDITDLVQAQAFINDFSALSKTLTQILVLPVLPPVAMRVQRYHWKKTLVLPVLPRHSQMRTPR